MAGGSGSGRCCASLLVVMLSALILLGIAEIVLYLYVRFIRSLSLCKTYCWLWAGALTVLFAASVLFLMVGVKKRSGCLVIAHFAFIVVLQASSWTLSELVEWRLWWSERNINEFDPNVTFAMGFFVSRCMQFQLDSEDEVGGFFSDTRAMYIEIYSLTTAWQAAGVAIATVATLMSCITYGCSRRTVNLLDVSARSSNSWEFVRVRSSTPKKNDRLSKRLSGGKGSSTKKQKDERRRLSFKGNELFGQDTPITPIPSPPTNVKTYGHVENFSPWRPPSPTPDVILDLSTTERSDDLSTFKKDQRTPRSSAMFEYEMGAF